MSNLSVENIDILVSQHQPENATLKNYVIVFVSSIVLTMSAYLLTYYHAGGRSLLFGLLAVLALIQFSVQLIFFLHVGKEFSPRLKLIVTLFMILVVLIIVGGSLWIMYNLNHRVMPSTKQMVQYMNREDNL